MNVIEELTEFEDRIDRAHVERRLDDWERRIDVLYARIAAWLPEGWAGAPDGTVPIDEPLMKRFGVAERRLPQLALSRRGAAVAKIQPRYLWIIGSNGRVDVTGSIGHHVLNDRSEFFEESSWQIAAFMARLDEVPLTAESFRRILQ